jgi:hypothetical protein
MKTKRRFPDLESAEEDAERLIDGLIDAVLDYDRDRSDSAADAVDWLRYRMTEAVLAAYPEARTSSQRQNLLRMLHGMILEWDTEARVFLRQVAQDDNDEDVRMAAADVLESLWHPQDLRGVGANAGGFGFEDLDADWP